MSVMLGLQMTVHFCSVQLSSHLIIYLLLGELCVTMLIALQIKCLETTAYSYNTFMIKLTAHLNLEMIATIQSITFILQIQPL
jgi:hypothetical protein